MRKFSSAVALLFIVITSPAALGADSPPSDASLKRLIAVTEARKLVEGSISSIDASIEASIQQLLQGKPVSPQQQKIIDEMRTQLVAVMQDILKWDSLEPMFMDVYRRSLTQSEVDGMLAFYATPAGKAVIAKMPLIMQNTMASMQARMSSVMPQIVRIQQETLEKLKAAEKKS